MPLHNSKRVAILQWYNSLSSQDLQTIQQLSDGKFLCDILKSTIYFNEQAPVDVASEQLLEDNASEQLLVHNASEQLLVDNASEQSATDTAANKSETDAAVEQLQTESTDVQMEEIDSTEQAGCFTKVNTTEQSSENQEISERFKFLEEFIDSSYSITSENVVSYKKCINSNEFELAKTAILVLSAVVQYLLTTKDEKLNTLTLLDQKVQEDIQECLTVLLSVHTLTKKELKTILSKPAKYKANSRKSNSPAVTPQRSCSSKYKMYSSMSPSESLAEEVFTNSPLKSFLESPLFQRQMLVKEKELKRTRTTLIAEEIKCEDLQIQLDDHKKKIETKDKEIKELKNQLKECLAQLSTECESCKNLESMIGLSARRIKELEDNIKAYEVEVSEYISIITKLEGKIKSERSLHDKEKGELMPLMHEQKLQIIQIEREKIKELEAEVEELKSKNATIIAQYEEKLAEIKASPKVTQSPKSPVVFKSNGECVANFIEEDYKMLWSQLEEATEQIAELQKKNLTVELKSNSNYPAKSDDVVFSPELMDTSTQQIGTSRRSLRRQSDCNTSGHLHVPNLQKSSNVHTNKPFEVESNSSPNEDSDAKHILWIRYDSMNKRINFSNSNDNVWFEHVAMENQNKDLNSSSAEIRLSNSHVNDNIHSEEIKEHSVLNNNVVFNSPRENSTYTFLPNAAHCGSPNPQDIYKQIGFNKSDLPAKIKVVKKAITLLKEVFPKKSINGCIGINSFGDWEKHLKSEEDCILCLFYIKESLLKFQNSVNKNSLNNVASQDLVGNVDDSKNFIKNNKQLINVPTKCDNIFCAEKIEALEKENHELNNKVSEFVDQCSKVVILKHLKQEKEELQQKVQYLEIEKNSQIEAKVLEIDELKKKLSVQENQYRDLLTSYESLGNKTEDLSQKYADVQVVKKKLASRTTECVKYKTKLAELKTQASDVVKKYSVERNAAMSEAKRYRAEAQKNFAIAENERKEKKEIGAKYRLLNISYENQLQLIQSLTEEIKELQSLYDKIKKLYDNSEKRARAISSAKIAAENSINSKITNMKIEIGMLPLHRLPTKSDYEVAVSDSFLIKENEVTPLDTGNESVLSGALTNKSIHSGFLCNDDEEDFVNHSSLAEIKKEPGSDNIDPSRRQELHRRNTMCLPHLQSSYPVELQSLKPFSPIAYEHFRKRARDALKAETTKVPATKNREQKKELAQKKRKMSELDDNNGEGTSKKATTPIWRRPQQLYKSSTPLLKFIRVSKNQHNSAKAKIP